MIKVKTSRHPKQIHISPFLLLIVSLLIWKVVRTDWRIETTEHRSPESNAYGPVSYTSYTPPISPLWDRPVPVEFGREIESWDKAIGLWLGSGLTPKCSSVLKIDIWTILFDTVPFILIYGFIIVILKAIRRFKNRPAK